MAETLILFDVGGVLLELDYAGFYSAAAQLSGSQTTEEFQKRYNESDLEVKFLSGRIGSEEFMDSLGRLINPNLDPGYIAKEVALGKAWKAQIDENVELKERLFQLGYSTGLFSNIHPIASDVISRKWPRILHLPDPRTRIYSFEAGAVKPNHAMYDQASRLGFDNIIYIDDKASYLRTAVDVFGWEGILFSQFIDKSEAISLKEGTRGQKNGIIEAKSTFELAESLRQLGIKV